VKISTPFCLIVILPMLLVARSSSAQATRRTGYVNQFHTCRGFDRMDVRTAPATPGGGVQISFFVSGVDSLSPAGRAGLRNGDQVTSMNGVDLSRMQRGTTAYRDEPGSTNVLRVRNEQGEHEIRFVVGRWVKVGADSTCRDDPTGQRRP